MCLFLFCDFTIVNGQNIKELDEQEYIFFGSFALLEVKNDQIYKLLDSLEIYTNACSIDFKSCSPIIVLHVVDNDTLFFFEALQDISLFIKIKDPYKYYFYYKDRFIYVFLFVDFSLFFNSPIRDYDDVFDVVYLHYPLSQIQTIDEKTDELKNVSLRYLYKDNIFQLQQKGLYRNNCDYSITDVCEKKAWKRFAEKYNMTKKQVKSFTYNSKYKINLEKGSDIFGKLDE